MGKRRKRSEWTLSAHGSKTSWDEKTGLAQIDWKLKILTREYNKNVAGKRCRNVN
jgi:hypothetical protein